MERSPNAEIRGDVDVEGMDDGLRRLAPEDGGHGGKGFERGGEFFVATLGVGGEGEIARREFRGWGDGELGVLVADAVEMNLDGSAGLQAVRNIKPDVDGCRLRGVRVDTKENIEGLARLVDDRDYLTGFDRQRARRH